MSRTVSDPDAGTHQSPNDAADIKPNSGTDGQPDRQPSHTEAYCEPDQRCELQ